MAAPFCEPVVRMTSSTPPVTFPAPSAAKLPAMTTGPLASKPRSKNAYEPFMLDKFVLAVPPWAGMHEFVGNAGHTKKLSPAPPTAGYGDWLSSTCRVGLKVSKEFPLSGVPETIAAAGFEASTVSTIPGGIRSPKGDNLQFL